MNLYLHKLNKSIFYNYKNNIIIQKRTMMKKSSELLKNYSIDVGKKFIYREMATLPPKGNIVVFKKSDLTKPLPKNPGPATNNSVQDIYPLLKEGGNHYGVGLTDDNKTIHTILGNATSSDSIPDSDGKYTPTVELDSKLRMNGKTEIDNNTGLFKSQFFVPQCTDNSAGDLKATIDPQLSNYVNDPDRLERILKAVEDPKILNTTLDITKNK